MHVTTMPATSHDLFVRSKSSALIHTLFSQAQRVPKTPKRILGSGNSQPANIPTKKAHQQPLKKPQIGYIPKAPQVHFEVSTVAGFTMVTGCSTTDCCCKP